MLIILCATYGCFLPTRAEMSKMHISALQSLKYLLPVPSQKLFAYWNPYCSDLQATLKTPTFNKSEMRNFQWFLSEEWYQLISF